MIDSFLNHLQFEKRYSSKTILSYKTDLSQFRAFLTTFQSDFLPEHSSHAEIRAWIVSLTEEKIDPTSINRKIACLRSYFKFLMRQEVIDKDPMTKIRILKTRKKLPHFVNEADMVSLLDNESFSNDHAGKREQLILELFYGTGIRLSELINLNEDNVNLKERTIRVLGKRNKERVVPFSESIVPLIKEYNQAKKKEIIVGDHGRLFVSDTGEPLYPMLVYRIVKKYMKLFTSVEKKSPHVLRHTYATHLLNKGAEINAVKDLLGHSSLAATQVYTHNSLEKLKKVFEQAHPKA